jgi:hypothetical protein
MYVNGILPEIEFVQDAGLFNNYLFQPCLASKIGI